jgi:hypothetical protein
LKKAIRKCERNNEDEEDSNIHSYKRYKSKKDFESVLNNEVQKAKQERPTKRKSERDEPSYVTEDDDDNDTEDLIREHQLKRSRRFF